MEALPYSPGLVVGTVHIPENIDAVIDRIDKCIHNCKVGAEPYAYPLDPVIEPYCAEFFNAIGDYVIGMGSIYIPLGNKEAEDVCEANFKKQQGELIKFMTERINHFLDTKYGNSILGEGSKWRDLMWKTTSGRLSHISEKQQDRNDIILESIAVHQPRVVIVGAGHLPPILLKYPAACFDIIGKYSS